MSDADVKRMYEAFKVATISLIGATYAYEKFAKRSATVGKSQTDPFFTTRLKDMQKAMETAREEMLYFEGQMKGK